MSSLPKTLIPPEFQPKRRLKPDYTIDLDKRRTLAFFLEQKGVAVQLWVGNKTYYQNQNESLFIDLLFEAYLSVYLENKSLKEKGKNK